jgi:transposase
MEIITGVERRRQWRDEEKLRILAELDEPGVKFSAVARRHDISRSLLWQWRDARRRGRLVAETPAFVPLQVVPELSAPEAQKGPDPTRCVGPPEPCIGRSNFRPPGGVKPGHSGAPRPTS